jgi:hypothetical protein
VRKRGTVTTTARKWLGPACIVIAGALLLAVLLRPLSERSLIERGAAYTIMTYDLVLPLLGLGVAASQMRRWGVILVAIVFVAGIPVGIVGEDRLLAERRISVEFIRYIAFAGPLCCLIAAAALAPGGRVRIWITPAGALCCGTALGLLVAYHQPLVGDLRFVLGAGAAGLWLISVLPMVLGPLDRSWLKIGGRIFASWLAAIGLMLGGATFVTMQRADRPVAEPPPPAFPQSFDPVGAGIPESPPLNRGHESDDRSRQPW